MMPVPLGALVAVLVSRVPSLPDRAWKEGDLVDAIAMTGSNRFDATALLQHGAGESMATGTVSGPLWPDHLWYAATVEGIRGAGRGFGKVVWQVCPRSKLTLVGAQSAPDSDGRLLGLVSESLLTDSLVARVQAGLTDRPQGSLRLDYFRTGPLGEHAIGIGGRAARTGDPRTLVFLEDRWRPGRYLTITGALTHGGERPIWQGSLGLAWDATHDGRTVVRANASAGLLSAGAERELYPGLAASVDLVQRWIVFGLRQQSQRLRIEIDHERRADWSSDHLSRATLEWAWTTSLGLGALVTRAESWSMGLRARTELGRFVGFPLALFTDALGLPGAPGARLSLRSSF